MHCYYYYFKYYLLAPLSEPPCCLRSCCQPDPHPQHGFKANIFFLFSRAERESLVSSHRVKLMEGRQRVSLYGNRCLSSP